MRSAGDFVRLENLLGLNELRLEVPDGNLTRLVLGVAEGRVTKAEVAVFVRRHATRRKE